MRITIFLLLFVFYCTDLSSQFTLGANANTILLRSHATRLRNFDNLVSQKTSLQYGLIFRWQVNKTIPFSFNTGLLKSSYNISLSLNQSGWLPNNHKVPVVKGSYPIYQIPVSMSIGIKQMRNWNLNFNMGGSFLFNNGSDNLEHVDLKEYEKEIYNANFIVVTKYFIQNEGSNGFVVTLSSGLEFEYKLKNRLSLSITPGFQFGTRNLNSLIVNYTYEDSIKGVKETDKIFLDTKASGFSLGLSLNYFLPKKS